MERYQPIENYGIIGDLNTVALVGLNGSIDFLCFPGFDSPTIFASILDADKGGYQGYLPVETLSERNKPYDPFARVETMMARLNAAIVEVYK